ncbi:phosphoribosyltransferase family protein [Ruminococcus sp. Marseille-P6503]|uniref:ComF family protein n=1 Tax=Ruminococcus sp. Marseille-P6503 TaxID=2364796 RepID=UPI000F526DAE|nr:phosphoribosyltransferase family protein [Ruminococcus sp. Marseille-P6503]
MKLTNSRLLNCRFWLDMIFPNRCPCCGRVISWDGLLCEACKSCLPFLDDTPWQVRYSEKAGEKAFSFDYAVSAFSYEDIAVKGIYALKDGNGTNFAQYACGILCDKLENDGMDQADIVTAVPMSRRKKLSRGYNQAEIIARYLAGELGAATDFRLLKRTSDSLEQHSLNSRQRHEFAERIYYKNPKSGSIKGKTVILCDDVFTTGATMNKCSEILKEMGAEKVYCVSLCCTDKNLSLAKE